MKSVKSFFESLLGWIVIFVIIGLLTGNLGKWTGKIVYYVKALWHTASNIDIENKYEEGTPEDIIDKYIKALYAGDCDTATQYIDDTNPVLGMNTDILTGIFRSNTEDMVSKIFFEDMSNADYTIEGNETEFSVAFKTYNYAKIMEAIINYDGYAETDAEVYKVVKNKINGASKNVKYDIKFVMKNENGKWIISDYESKTEFLNAITGNFIEYALKDTEKGMETFEIANILALHKQFGK